MPYLWWYARAARLQTLREVYPGYTYISFVDLSYRSQFNEDLRGFLAQHGNRVIFDEAQRVPDLFSYLQGVVDEDRTPGRFILSGSQNFLLLENITQSLAGRVGIVRLLPLDFRELKGAGMLPQTAPEAIFRGGYPASYQIGIPPEIFYPSYLSSYLERDISHLVRESNMGEFRLLLEFCAAGVGQTLDYTYFAKRLRLSGVTVKKWIHHLIAGYIVFTVGPYFDNFGKRLVKAPKLYFTDTGLATYLLRLRSAEEVKSSNYYGALFENMVVANRYKQRHHAGDSQPFYHFRDTNGVEVDLLDKAADTITLTEIKASQTIREQQTKNLRKIAGAAKEDQVRLEVIYGGRERTQAFGAEYIPWSEG